jgi:hypothetical protein
MDEDLDPDYAELIEEFKRAGQMPMLWQWTARDLICAANALHARREATLNARLEELKARKKPRPRGIDTRHSSINPIMLLYGLALENLLKALLVAQGVDATATGELNSKLKTHNLLNLWRESGLPVAEGNEDLLRRLHWAVETGKYPVGTKPNPKDPSPVWVALTSIGQVLKLLETAEDALRERRPKETLEKIDLATLCGG